MVMYQGPEAPQTDYDCVNAHFWLFVEELHAVDEYRCRDCGKVIYE